MALQNFKFNNFNLNNQFHVLVKNKVIIALGLSSYLEIKISCSTFGAPTRYLEKIEINYEIEKQPVNV